MVNKKKVLVIIGGSGGIGAAIARLAAKENYRIILGFYKQKKIAEQLINEITGNGGDATSLSLDVTNAVSVKLFFEEVINVYGIPDGLAHCSGATGPRGDFMNLNSRAISELLEVNLTGTFICVQEAAKLMAISQGGIGGSIVVLSSEAAKFGGNLISPYAASKAGINAMVVGVARELAQEGIRLNAVSPGVIDTDQHANITKERHAFLLNSIPIGRMGSPIEVANAIFWLLSDNASYVTGSILTVAGGR